MKPKLLLMFICLGLAFTAHAIQPIPATIEQLTQRAQLVLHGTVVSKTVERDDAGRIRTRVELAVTEVWKGGPTNRFTLVHGGGTLGEETSVVSGQVEYEVGEELVAFLVLNQRGEGVTIGLAQGKFKVWRDEATGEKRTRNLFHGGDDPPRARNLNATEARPRLTLTELKRQVQGGTR